MSLIPILPTGKFVDEDGNLTSQIQNFFDVLLQNLRKSVGEEGFQISAQPQASVNLIEEGAINGTTIFNSSAINGGSSDAPNGQLFVKLADGTFHAIPNL